MVECGSIYVNRTSRCERVDLYALCVNERQMIPCFLRNYWDIVDCYVIFNGGSMGGSRDLPAGGLASACVPSALTGTASRTARA